LFSLAVAPGVAATILFQGSFAQDNTVAVFDITANTSETVTIQTYGYAGGTVNATPIPAGGFAPSAFLFDNLGDVQTLSSGSCGQVGTDPTTGNCDDLYFQDALGPGLYTLALVVDDNSPAGTFLSDGFVDDSPNGPNFTCAEAGGSGRFCDLTAALPLQNVRTGNYAVSISGADSAVVGPEPGSMVLLLAGGALTILLKRRSSNSKSI